MKERVTTWREGCNDSKEGSPHGGKGVMIQRKGTLPKGKGHHMEGMV